MVIPLILGLQEKSKYQLCEENGTPKVGCPRLAGVSPYLPAHPGLLQQVLLNLCPLYGSPFVEVDVDVLPKPAGIVITDGLRVPKSCKNYGALERV